MSEAPVAPLTRRKVLVADDEQVIANTLAIILNQAGFEARAVYSGERALEALEHLLACELQTWQLKSGRSA